MSEDTVENATNNLKKTAFKLKTEVKNLLSSFRLDRGFLKRRRERVSERRANRRAKRK